MSRGTVYGAILLGLRLLSPACAADDPGVVHRTTKEIAELGGDWTRVSRTELDRLMRAAAAGPRSAQLTSVEYVAAFDGRSLRGGQLTARIRALRPRPEWVELTGCNLALRDLRGGGRPLKWGTTRDGRVLARVADGRKEIMGDWSAPGEPVGQSVRFALRLLPAVTSQLRLRVPAGWRVEARTGDVAEPIASSGGGREYRVDVSGTESVNVFLTPEKPSVVKRPVRLYECETTYDVRAGGLLVRSRNTFEVLNAPVRAVTFRLPRGLDVYSVRYGGQGSLAFAVRQSGGERRLVVRFPDPLLGPSRPVIIDAVAPLHNAGAWTLPRIEPLATLFRRGQVHLHVERPIELRSFSGEGLRQEAYSQSPTPESISFRQQLAEATLRISAAIPRTELACRAISRLTDAGTGSRYVGELNWSVRRGVAHTFDCRLVPGWRITAAKTLAATGASGGDLTWTETRLRSGARRVTFKPPKGLPAGRSLAVRIEADRERPVRRRLAAPIVPIGLRDVEQVLLIPKRLQPRDTAGNAAFESIASSRLPEFARQSQLWGGLTPQEKSSSGILYARSGSPIRFDVPGRNERTFDAVAWTVCRARGGGWDAVLAVTIRGASTPVESVLVYLSQPAEFQWSPAAKPNERLKAARLVVARHAEFGLPGGALWEIALPKAGGKTRGPVRLLARRASGAEPFREPPLVAIPRARRFDGFLQVSASPGVKLETRGLFPVTPRRWERDQRPPVSAAPRGFTTTQYRYRDTAAGLKLGRPSSTGDAAHRVPSRTLELWSVLSGTARGRDRHRAVFGLAPTATAGEFAFRIDDSATIVSVALNGTPVVPVRVGEEYVVQSLPAGKPAVVEVRYTSPSRPVGVRTNVQIVRPYQATPPHDVRWHLAVPPGVRVVGNRSKMVVSPVAETPGWGTRLFGPLASVSANGVFNPFDGASWRRLFDLQRPGGEPASAMPDESAWAPAGWPVFTARGTGLPPELSVELTDAARAWHWSWLAALAGFAAVRFVGRKRISRRGALGVWWFSLALAAVWVVPPHFAIIAGGCFVGSLCGVVLPRRLKQSAEIPDISVSGIPMGSTVSYPRVVSGLLLAAGLGLVSASAASQPASKTATVDRNTLIVPSDSPNKDDVYVHRTRLERLRRNATPPSPQYLLQRADYRVQGVAARSADVTARFDVVALGDPATTVLLPLRGAHLCGPDACTVDGRVQPVRRDKSGAGFLVDLPAAPQTGNAGRTLRAAVGAASGVPARPPAFRTLKLKLCLRVPVEHRRDGSSLSFQVPPVLNGRAILHLPDTGRPVSVPGLTDVQRDAGWFLQTIVAKTGAVDKLEVREGADHGASSAQVAVRVQAVAEVNAAIQVNLRASYRVDSGRVSTLPWRVPANWVLRRVWLEGDDAGGLSSRVVNRGRGRTNLRIDLPQPQSQPFVVLAEFVVPSSGAMEKFRIDAPLLHHGPAFAQTGAQFGIATSAEYELKLDPVDQSVLPPLDAAARDQLHQAFPSRRRAPSAAFDVRGPARVTGKLLRRAPQRDVQSHQRLLVHRDRLDVTWTADATVSRARAFVHKLAVDPRLQIESIRVIEEKAPRLARWSRTGNVVWLFLSGETIARQRIVVRGHVPLKLPARFRPPALALFDARTSRATLDVFRDRTVGVEVLNPGHAKPALPAVAVEQSPGARVGGFLIESAGKAPQFQVRPRAESLQAERLAVLRRNLQRRSSLQCTFRLTDALPASTYAVRIPKAIADAVRLDGTGWTVERRETGDDAATWVCRPEARINANRKAGLLPPLSFQIDVSPNESPAWDVPLPELPFARGTADVLAIADELGRFGLGPGIERAAIGDLPEWMRDGISTDNATLARRRNGRGGWQVSTQGGATQSQRPHVPLMQTQFWCSEDGCSGRTEIFASAAETLTLAVPTDLAISDVRVDGRPVSARPDRSGALQLQFAARGVHWVRVDWRHPSTRSLWNVARVRRALPAPASLNVDSSLIAFRTSPAVTAYSLAGMTREERVPFLLNQLETLVAIARNAADSPVAARRALAAAEDAGRALSRSIDRGAVAGERDVHARAARAREQMAALRKRPELQPREEQAAGFGLLLEPATLRDDPRTVFGRLERTADAPTLEYRPVADRLSAIVLALAVLLLVLPFLRRLLRLQLGERMTEHEPAWWILLGAAWLLLLAPAAVGLLLMGIGGWKALRNRRHARDVESVIQLFER